MKILCLLLAVGLLVLNGTAKALVANIEVRPGQSDNSLAFDIHSERLPNGDIQFTFRITEKATKFPSVYGTSLGDWKRTYDPERPQFMRSEETTSTRSLASERHGNVVTCVFSVKAKEMEDPDLCFFFGFPAEDHFPGGTNYVARLKNFIKP